MRKLWDLLRNKIGTKNLICGILGICIAVGWNRREADTSFGLSKVFCAAGKTTDQCIDEDGL